MKKKFTFVSMPRWQLIVFIAMLVAIVLHFLIDQKAKIHQISTKDIPLLVVLVVGGVPLILQILLKLLHRDFGADALAAIAMMTGIYLGEYLAASIVMLMLASGQILESYALRKASSVLRILASRMPSKAHHKIEEVIEDIAINKIKVGDNLVIYPHETCPADGIIIEGHGSMDESYLTGEPYHVSKAPGTTVLSGSINGETLLVIRATRKPQDSRYARIIKVMEESEQKRPAIRRLGDQWGAIFTPITLLIAFATWYVTGDAVRFLAVLVIATPCPLLIAIPIAIISAISLAARKGIIIRDPVVLERLTTCKTAIFDKTGTLTYGRAELTDIYSFPGFDKKEVLQLVASLERFSKHPLSGAILNAAQESHLDLRDFSEVHENPGKGLEGVINGQTIQITNRVQALNRFPDQIVSLPQQVEGMECVVLINEKIAALFRFRDSLRIESESFIKHLTPIHQFKKIIIVSGDRLSEVAYIGKQLGIKEIYAGKSPEEKVEIVRQETLLAPTLFMGDGINDAPALAAATVGLAFGAQNIAATESAGAVILENSLGKVDILIHISRLMRRVAIMSAGGGMLLSIIGMYFAAIGMIQPVMGALLQEGVDVLAIINALQLTWQSKITADFNNHSLKSE